MFLRSHTKNSGFTLFELMVAIAVVGLMFGIVVTQTGDFFDTNIKNATNKISNTVRYLRDKSSTENLYIRLVFDFEKNNYWVEATTDQFLLASKEVAEAEQKEKEKEAKEAKNAPKDEEPASETADGETTEAVSYVKKYRTPEFGAIDDFLLKPTAFPEGVFLKDVYTSHDEAPVGAGQAFIYFFPNGFIEPSIINLRDAADEVVFSIEINPVVGSTNIRQEYRALEKEK